MSEFLYKRCRECRLQVPPSEQLVTVCRHTLCRDCWAAIVAQVKDDPRNLTNKCPICGQDRLRLVRVGDELVPPPAAPDASASRTAPPGPREKAEALIARGFSLDDIDALMAAPTAEDVPGYSRARVAEFRRIVN
jgi:hypothetical protein